MNGEFEIPVPEPSDSEDVSTALETAEVLWSSGNRGEAMRLLRLAAEKASDAGDDMRAVQLARVAAEIRESARPPAEDAPPEPAAPSPAYPPDEPPAPEAPVSMSHTVRVEEMNMQVYAAVDAATTAPEPIEHAAPTMPDATYAGGAEDESESEDEERFAPEDRTDPDEEARSTTPTPVPSRPTAAGPRPRKALRVAVLPGADHEGFLEVRVLADHEIPPVGAHEALLVALDADVDLLAR